MAHIVDFTIEGLAGRKEVYKQRLNRDINVFFGLNGSGKTSLLRILDSAMDGDASRIKMVPFQAAQVTIYSIQERGKIVRTIKKGMKREKQIPATFRDIYPPKRDYRADEGAYFEFVSEE